MPGAILFDLDETLILRSGAIRAFAADQYRLFAPRLGGIDAATYLERFLDLEDNGRIAKDKFYPVFVAALGITGVDAETLLEDYRARYADFATLSPGAAETVAKLRADGYRTGILTNGNERVQMAKLTAIGLLDQMDAVVISEAVGLKKPDPAIFLLAAEKLGVAPAEITFVGDNPEVDIVGAAATGLRTVWFRNGETWPEGLTPRANLDIDSLPELLPWLEG